RDLLDDRSRKRRPRRAAGRSRNLARVHRGGRPGKRRGPGLARRPPEGTSLRGEAAAQPARDAGSLIEPNPRASSSARLATTCAPQAGRTRGTRRGPRSAARARSVARRGALGQQLADQRLHATVELVADPPDGVEILAGRVVDLPVLVLLPGVDR